MCAAYAGFRHFEEHGKRGYALTAHFEPLKQVLLTREGCVSVPGAGRGGVSRFSYPGGEGFLRVYRRGGVVRHFLSETYILQNRPLHEFQLLHRLHALGLSVPELLGAVWMQIGPCYRGAIATRALVGNNLLETLRDGPAPTEATLHACGELIHRMHALQVLHADLNAANLFLTPDGPVLLDFDKASLLEKPLPSEFREKNLARLRRSFEKNALPASTFEAILHGYREAKA